MKLGEVSPEMMEVGLWALAGHIAPGEMQHVDQQAMLKGVYHAMRTTEGDLSTTPAPSISKASSAETVDLGITSMVERVAQAIYDAPTSFDGDTVATHLCQSMMIDASSRNLDEMLDIVRSVCRDAARAAIEATREPTPAMLAAAPASFICDEHWPHTVIPTLSGGASATWRAMIDAALSEAPTC